ncbi:flagellar transcriptional regulator FlhC [[Enterobacter] lignolyticus]|uniref:Flagellar transcriptional regulator FlhC n=1 Tax=[Enterobacter] lignolyticus TaxID=1334193 RepID=A0A806X9D1_9ENTR|nr:flagellar transcriptional regulator FlhC [[Enterobacter] lignolyticus]ALR78514.1 transcriptional regulator [[Enterobacter] lignolyticus]
MQNKSIIQEANDIRLAMKLIALGARLPMLESETELSRGKLIKLYKEVLGYSPPKGMLPFSVDWFMVWEQNIHASVFLNIYTFFLQLGDYQRIDAITKSYELYLEQFPSVVQGDTLLGINRAWMLVRFMESDMLCQTCCNECSGMFVSYAYEPAGSFTCSLCRPPSRAVKKRCLTGA